MTGPCCERNARLETSSEYDDRTGDSLSGDVAIASRDIMIERCRENVDGIRASENRDGRPYLRAVSAGGVAVEPARAVAIDLQRASDIRVALEDICVDAVILMREANAAAAWIVAPALMRNIDWAREAAGLEPFAWPAKVAAPAPVEFKQAAE